MRFTVEIPKTVAEDDRMVETVEADTVEEAILLAYAKMAGGNAPSSGDKFVVTTRVEVVSRSRLPLRSF